jgi:glycosyltransferase involved in cell wall biosynthesis
VIHNWADGDAIKPFPFARDGRLKVFYSGNMGLAHDFETVIPALIELDSGFRFRFSGGGPQRNAVSKALASFDHCEFEGYHERSDLGEVFGANDVGLVTQRAETVGTLVPSKFYGILAAGRGVLYVGPRDSTIGAAISEYGIGWQVANGDVDGLKRLLWQLRLEPEMVEETGRRARVVFERNFSKVGQVNKILRILQGERFVDRDVVVDRHL